MTESLFPRVAVGAVILAEHAGTESVVLIRRGQSPLKSAWSLPGGRVERGETLAQAVVREAREETGIDVSVVCPIEVFELITDTHHYVIHNHLCTSRGGDLRAGDDAHEARWVPLGQLAQWHATQDIHRVVDLARRLAVGVQLSPRP